MPYISIESGKLTAEQKKEWQMKRIVGISGSMVIGTSALAQYDIDGAVGMYSGIFNNPFVIWSKYRKRLLKTTLTVSFQFHHTQMDGAHAARFLDFLQQEINAIH